jgi:hypothetical protein
LASIHPGAALVDFTEWEDWHRQTFAGGWIEEVDVAQLETGQRDSPAFSRVRASESTICTHVVWVV